jgi:iron complex outermembrane recepter protein
VIVRTSLILLFILGLSISATVRASQLLYTDTLRNDSSNLQKVDLDELVVTSFRYNANIRNISAPIQIIGKNKLENNALGDLAAVLNTVPGLQMQSGTFQTTKITIRGIGSRSPYSTNRTRAFLDDIPLTTGDGTTVLDDIELTFIDKIEITKGPHSAWYGSGMGGSLRFVSLREADKPFVAEAAVSLGSFGLQKYSGNVRMAKPTGYLNVGLARISGDGYRQNSSFSRNSVFVSGENRKQNKLNYLFLYSGVNSQTPSSIDEQTFFNTPSLAAANWLNVKGRKDYERFLGGVRLESPFGKQFKNITTLSGSIYDQYELRPFNVLDDKAMSFTLQENLKYSHEKFSMSAGFEWLHENYFWRILENNSLLEKQKSNEIRNQLNAYLSFETKLLSTLILSASGNLNSTRYAVSDLFTTDEIDYSGNYFNKLIFSPKIGLNYLHNSNVSFYASTGHGFSNPTAEESLTSQGFLNAALRPEQGWTMDIGARGTAFDNIVSYEVSAYAISLDDLLVTKRISEEIFYGENAGRSTLKGVELQLKYKPAAYFQTLVSFSKSDNKFKEFISDNVNYANKQLPGIPKMNATVDMQTVLFKNLQLNAIYTYNGAQFLNDANSKQYNAWQTVNFRAGYTLNVFQKYKVQLIATVNNLFDEKYASMILVNAPSFGNRPPRYFYPALPRNFLVTLKFK